MISREKPQKPWRAHPIEREAESSYPCDRVCDDDEAISSATSSSLWINHRLPNIDCGRMRERETQRTLTGDDRRRRGDCRENERMNEWINAEKKTDEISEHLLQMEGFGFGLAGTFLLSASSSSLLVVQLNGISDFVHDSWFSAFN